MTTPAHALYDAPRHEMVEQIALHTRLVEPRTGRPAIDRRVLEAMARVPRHEFVPVELRAYAYVDSPLPIGCGKTISQPFIVALMTDLLDVQPGHVVLEVGTGLGYQAAVLAELAAKVCTVEIIEDLANEARERLQRLGYDGVVARTGDAANGWSELGPYDRIIVTAAPELIPPPLLGQLKPGGRMVVPAGIEDAQVLMLVEKDAGGRLSTREILPVRFSALTTEE